MAEAGEKLLKILCIHGYRQNGQTFRERTGAFRKIIKKRAELVFITAPNSVPPMQPTDGQPAEPAEPAQDQRGWWFSRKDDYFHAADVTDCCKGYEESLKVIEETVKDQGPFDGILGFSQGASMVSLVCGLQQQNPDGLFRFRFAILVAGFKSGSSGHNALYDQTISLPTLHVFGDTDKVISKEMSEELLTSFGDVTTLTHPGGHFVPASGPQKKVYIEFLTKMAAQS